MVGDIVGTTMATITLTKRRITREKGLVILPIAEYRRLQERAVPEYFLTGKAARDLDKLVEEGLREHALGKTIRAASVKEALRTYAEKNRKR